MATLIYHLESAQQEPLTRIILREVPNFRNPAVAEEYKRQRAIINAAAAAKQSREMEFWESVQSHEGWV